jgi:hypothetical protein
MKTEVSRPQLRAATLSSEERADHFASVCKEPSYPQTYMATAGCVLFCAAAMIAWLLFLAGVTAGCVSRLLLHASNVGSSPLRVLQATAPFLLLISPLRTHFEIHTSLVLFLLAS